MTNLHRIMHLFRGQDRAYGTYDLSEVRYEHDGAKRVGKAKTISGKVDEALWQKHLDGRQSLGIVPIRDDSTCFWGAIDVDVYRNFDMPAFIKTIYDNDLPLVPCRSKSGGLHCYLFVRDAVPAREMREKLATLAAFLKQGEAEIFPKQVEVLAERGDFGSWINMPYAGIESKEQTTDRHAWTADSRPMGFADFLKYADKRSFTVAEFRAYTVRLGADIDDGPPCLQTLVGRGINAGMRNTVMFNIAVYLRKSGRQDLGAALDEFNAKYCQPQLSSDEINKISQSCAKKDFHYACNKSPLKECCALPTCRARKFGVGGLVGMPELASLTKFNSMPPIWFVNVDDGKRIELATEDLQNQQRFQRRCMESINAMPPTLKPQLWQSIVQRLLDGVVVIEAPKEASPEGIFYEYLERFCTARVSAKVVDEILLGRPFSEGGKTLFRLMDLLSYLERQKFKSFTPQKISILLRDLSGEHQTRRIKGKTVNLWSIPEFASAPKDFAAPEIEGEGVI